MVNTYYQLYAHGIFAVKYRNAVISEDWKDDFISIIENLINETGCKTYLVNGTEDHIHCLFGFTPDTIVFDVMKSIRAKSSKLLNDSGLSQNRFEWQKGFGVFSYGHSDANDIFKYVQDQEEYHKNKSFSEEYLELLTKFEVEDNEKYLFEDLM